MVAQDIPNKVSTFKSKVADLPEATSDLAYGAHVQEAVRQLDDSDVAKLIQLAEDLQQAVKAVQSGLDDLGDLPASQGTDLHTCTGLCIFA